MGDAGTDYLETILTAIHLLTNQSFDENPAAYRIIEAGMLIEAFPPRAFDDKNPGLTGDVSLGGSFRLLEFYEAFDF